MLMSFRRREPTLSHFTQIRSYRSASRSVLHPMTAGDRLHIVSWSRSVQEIPPTDNKLHRTQKDTAKSLRWILAGLLTARWHPDVWQCAAQIER